VAAERSDLLRAARLWGATERLHQATRSAPPWMRFLYCGHLPTWQRLGGEAFQAARAAGMQLPTEQVVAEALPR
jgi:hypothetical protein